MSLIPLSVFLILAYMVTILVAWSLVCYIAPKHYHKKEFRMRTAFLLARWRPQSWWFTPWSMLRNCMVAMTPVFYPTDGNMQLCLCSTIQVVYLLLVGTVLPWRDFRINMCDALVTVAVICLCNFSLGIGTIEQDSAGLDERVDDYGVFFVIPLVLACAAPFLGFHAVLTSKQRSSQSSEGDSTAVIESLRRVFAVVDFNRSDDLVTGLDTYLTKDEKRQLVDGVSVILRDVYAEKPAYRTKPRLFLQEISQTTAVGNAVSATAKPSADVLKL